MLIAYFSFFSFAGALVLIWPYRGFFLRFHPFPSLFRGLAELSFAVFYFFSFLLRTSNLLSVRFYRDP